MDNPTSPLEEAPAGRSWAFAEIAHNSLPSSLPCWIGSKFDDKEPPIHPWEHEESNAPTILAPDNPPQQPSNDCLASS